MLHVHLIFKTKCELKKIAQKSAEVLTRNAVFTPFNPTSPNFRFRIFLRDNLRLAPIVYRLVDAAFIEFFLDDFFIFWNRNFGPAYCVHNSAR